MKRAILTAVAISILGTTAYLAQSQPPAAPAGQKTLEATMNVYVFPKAGQGTSMPSRCSTRNSS